MEPLIESVDTSFYVLRGKYLVVVEHPNEQINVYPFGAITRLTHENMRNERSRIVIHSMGDPRSYNLTKPGFFNLLEKLENYVNWNNHVKGV